MSGLNPAGERVNLSELMLEVGRVEEGSKVESCQGKTDSLSMVSLNASKAASLRLSSGEYPSYHFCIVWVSILVTTLRPPMHSAHHVHRRGQGGPNSGNSFNSRSDYGDNFETYILCLFRAYSKKKCLTFRAICNTALMSHEAPTLWRMCLPPLGAVCFPIPEAAWCTLRRGRISLPFAFDQRPKVHHRSYPCRSGQTRQR